MIAYVFILRYNLIEIISPDNLIPIPLLNKVDCTPAVYFVIGKQFIITQTTYYQLKYISVLFHARSIII